MRRAVLHRRVAEAIEKVIPPKGRAAGRPGLPLRGGSRRRRRDQGRRVVDDRRARRVRETGLQRGPHPSRERAGAAPASRARRGCRGVRSDDRARTCPMGARRSPRPYDPARRWPDWRTSSAMPHAWRCGLLADYRGMPATIGATDDERVRAIEVALEAMGDEPSIERALLTSELALALIYAPGSYERRRTLVEDAVGDGPRAELTENPRGVPAQLLVVHLGARHHRAAPSCLRGARSARRGDRRSRLARARPAPSHRARRRVL